MLSSVYIFRFKTNLHLVLFKFGPIHLYPFQNFIWECLIWKSINQSLTAIWRQAQKWRSSETLRGPPSHPWLFSTTGNWFLSFLHLSSQAVNNSFHPYPTVFIHGRLDEDIYLSTRRVCCPRPSDICFPNDEKPLWAETNTKGLEHWMNEAIIEYGLTRLEEDQCVYYRVEEENWIVATFFVNDSLICGTKKIIEKIVDQLKKKFELRTLSA